MLRHPSARVRRRGGTSRDGASGLRAFGGCSSSDTPAWTRRIRRPRRRVTAPTWPVNEKLCTVDALLRWRSAALTQCDTALAGFAFRHSRAGAKPLFVDLSSAAVGVLAEACDRAARRWSACRSPSKGPHGTPSV